MCRVQSAYENHKDEVVWNGDINSPVVNTEAKVLYSQDGGVPTPRATFNSTGIQTDCEVVTSPAVATPTVSAPAVSAIPGVYCE